MFIEDEIKLSRDEIELSRREDRRKKEAERTADISASAKERADLWENILHEARNLAHTLSVWAPKSDDPADYILNFINVVDYRVQRVEDALRILRGNVSF